MNYWIKILIYEIKTQNNEIYIKYKEIKFGYKTIRSTLSKWYKTMRYAYIYEIIWLMMHFLVQYLYKFKDEPFS